MDMDTQNMKNQTGEELIFMQKKIKQNGMKNMILLNTILAMMKKIDIVFGW